MSTAPPSVLASEVDAHLRSLASETARLPPELLAQVSAAAVARVRGASRKFGQKLIFQTNVPFTATLLLHPVLDALVTTSASDEVSAWSTEDGSPVLRFAAGGGGGGGGGAALSRLWPPSVHARLRLSAHALLEVATQHQQPQAHPPHAQMTPSRERGALLNVNRVSGGSLPLRPALSSAFARLGRPDGIGGGGGAAAAAAVPRFDGAFALLDMHSRASVVPAPAAAAARVSSTLWLDEHESCHLLTGSTDGRVRVWSGDDIAAAMATSRWATAEAEAREDADRERGGQAERPQRAAPASAPANASSSAIVGEAPRLLGAFCASPEASCADDAQTSLAYLPGLAQLAAASSLVPLVRLWDLRASACVCCLELPSAAAATCISSAWPGTHILAVGTVSGAVHILDTRSRSGVVRTFREHAPHYVVGIAQARTGSCYAIVSGSVAGDVCYWDLRVERSLRSVLSHPRGAMTCLAAHDFAPLIATGSLRQQVRVLSNAGEDVDEISFHESFGSDRLAPVTAVAWHPAKLLLAVGARDSLISLRVAS